MKNEFEEYLEQHTASMTADELARWTLAMHEGKAASRARDFGVAVREARAVLGITQIELAEKSGVQQREISRIEKCSANPTLKTVNKLVLALGGHVVYNFEANPAVVAALSVAPLEAASFSHSLGDNAGAAKAS